MSIWRWYSALAMALLPAGAAYGLGNLTAQEKADVVFRPITIPGFNIEIAKHSGIYIEYVEGQVLGEANPGDLTKHSVIEMTGVGSSNSASEAVGTRGIQIITLAQFKAINGQYFGSFTKKDTLPPVPRGKLGSSDPSRIRIIETAKLLKLQGIDYIVGDGDPISLLLTNYIAATDINGDELISVNEIQRMRSDAFVEYCYARNGLALVGPSITTRIGMEILVARSAEGIFGVSPLFPDQQLEGLAAGAINAPTVRVFDSGREITGGVSAESAVTIVVDDALSGPGRLELSKDDAFNQANSGLDMNGVYSGDADNTSRTFAAAQLPVLGNLPEGRYSVRAIDQAGNEATTVSFTLDNSPPEEPVLKDCGGNAQLLKDADGAISRAECLTISVKDSGSGISSVEVSGPGGFSKKSGVIKGENAATKTLVFGSFGALGDLTPGTYTAVVKNSAGLTKTVEFSIANDTTNQMILKGEDSSGRRMINAVTVNLLPTTITETRVKVTGRCPNLQSEPGQNFDRSFAEIAWTLDGETDTNGGCVHRKRTFDGLGFPAFDIKNDTDPVAIGIGISATADPISPDLGPSEVVLRFPFGASFVGNEFFKAGDSISIVGRIAGRHRERRCGSFFAWLATSRVS